MMNRYTHEGLVDLLNFFQNAPVGLHIVGPDGLIQRANCAELRMLGYENHPENYIGKHIAQFHADEGTIGSILDTLLRGDPIVGRCAELLHRDGSKISVVIHSTSRMLRSEFLNTRCVTYRKPGSDNDDVMLGRNEDAIDQLSWLEEREKILLYEQLDDFFENAPIALHIVDSEGKIVRANRIDLQNLGYLDQPELYIGHHIAEFHADQSVIEDMLNTLIHGNQLMHHRARLLKRSGEAQTVFIYSSPRMENGELLNTRCFTFTELGDELQQVERLAWPRNEGDELVLGKSAPKEQQSGRTAALRYLSGRKRVEESLALLSKSSVILNATTGCRETIPEVLRLTVPFIADYSAVIGVKDFDKQELLGAYGVGALYGDLKLLLQKELLDYALQQTNPGQPRELNASCFDLSDYACENSGAPLLGCREGGVRYILEIPLQAYGRRVGTFFLIRTGSKEQFGPADVALSEELGRRIALAIRFEQVHQMVNQDQRELQ